MYCHCGKKFTYGGMGKGPHGWQDKRVQYCGTCGNMSHVVQELEERPVYAPLGARAPQNHQGRSDGTSSTFWWTDVPNTKVEVIEYSPYPFTKVNGMDQGRNHLMKIWQKLDDKIDRIRGAQPGEDALIEFEKAQGLAFAEVLAQLMSPFYADTNAVLAESMTRWKARQAGEQHQSPGLGEALWDSTRRFDGPITDDRPARGGNVGATAIKPTKSFDDKQVTFIRHCLDNAIQSPEALAQMFSCSVEDIKSVMDAG